VRALGTRTGARKPRRELPRPSTRTRGGCAPRRRRRLKPRLTTWGGPVQAVDMAVAETMLGSLDAALGSADVVQAARALRALANAEPNWRRLVARLGAIADPASPSYDTARVVQALQCLLAATQTLATTGIVTHDDVVWIASLLLLSKEVGSRLDVVRSRLAGVGFTKDSLSTQTFRLGVLMEHQARLGFREVTKRTVNRTLDPFAHVHDEFELPGGGMTSVQGAIEQLVESAELILRYGHFQMKRGRCQEAPDRSPRLIEGRESMGWRSC
jgi:hypothetical protein